MKKEEPGAQSWSDGAQRMRPRQVVTASTASELRTIVNETTMMIPLREQTAKRENIESPELTLSLSDSDRGESLTRQFVFSSNLALM